MLHDENQLVRSFKKAMELLSTNNYKVVICADRRLPGEHERRYSAPTELYYFFTLPDVNR